MLTFQDLILTLQQFWAKRGCVVQQPYDSSMGAGTFHPATFLRVLDDMREANIDILTIGQYLRPSAKHHPVMKYWSPEEFDELKYLAEKKGFGMVASGPLVRSSFHADEVFQGLKLSSKKR